MKQISSGQKQSHKESEERNKQLIKNSPIGLFETDANGKFLFVNKRWSEISGFSEEKALNLSLMDLVFEKDQAKVASELTTSANEKSKFKSEFRISKPDGTQLWVYGIANVLVDKKKNVKGFSGAIVEIIPEKKTEEILKEDYKLFEEIKDSERKLAEAQYIANIGSWEWNIAKKFITWSDQLYRIFEMKPGTKITLNSYFDKIHPKDLDFVKNTIFDAKEKKRSFNFPHRILLQNNVVKYLHCRGTVIVDNNNEPVIMQGTAEDITEERKKEEKELKKKLQTIRFQATLLELSKSSNLSLKETYEKITETDAKQINTERVGIWLYNESRSAIICYCLYNKRIKKHSFDITILKRDAPNYLKALEESRTLIVYDAIKDPATSQLSEFYLKPIGITSMLDVPIRAQGKLLGVLCHEHIGSKRKWTREEQSFASSVADIIAISIESHNRRIAEIELNLLNEKLEVANEHKSQFISVISHDLRNPISSIISASSLLIDHFEELAIEDTHRMLKIINNSSKEALHHFDQLIQIAKKENHASLFYPEKLSLLKEVREDLKLVLQIAEQKNIIINNKIKKGVFINADKIMLKSILQNLLTNAIKFSFEGGKIDIYSSSQNNKEQITIRDYGLGMSREKLSNLFSGGEHIKSKKGTIGESGSGLGLRIVKDFVEKHNGNIEVESEEGKGTSISFTLPSETY